MEQVNITLPFSDEEIDKYFYDIDNYFFNINYDKTELKGQALINYIANSNMKCNICFNESSTGLEELLAEYIKTNRIVSIPSLNQLWNEIILSYLLNDSGAPDKENFIKNNQELMNEVVFYLEQLMIALNLMIEKEEYSQDGREELTFELIGNNIISIKNDNLFWEIMNILPYPEKEYYCPMFREYVYDGYTILYHFLNDFNPFGIHYKFLRRDIRE